MEPEVGLAEARSSDTDVQIVRRLWVWGGGAREPKNRSRSDAGEGGHSRLIVARDHDVDVWQVAVAPQRRKERPDPRGRVVAVEEDGAVVGEVE